MKTLHDELMKIIKTIPLKQLNGTGLIDLYRELELKQKEQDKKENEDEPNKN